jgi:hypothetical protein
MRTPRVPPGAVRKYSLMSLTAKLNKRGDNLDPSLRPCGMSKNSSVGMRGWRTRLFMFEYRLLVFIHSFFCMPRSNMHVQTTGLKVEGKAVSKSTNAT